MATTPKVLGQEALAATTLTDVYTVPSATKAVVSTIVVCNRGTATTFRVSLAKAGASDTTKQYLYYDQALPANATFTATVGIGLETTDVVRAYAASANVSVNVLGTEIT